jgi:hypothetical protein
MAIVELQTGTIVRKFPGIPLDSSPRWTADGKALAYIVTENGIGNVASKPLNDGVQKMLTDFKEDMLFSLDISRDGADLALVRGVAVSDVVVLQRSR